jgi:hypothetical protein
VSALQDIKGQRFSRLRVLYYEGRTKWVCKCDCGRKKAVKAADLKSGNTKSCGCIHKEVIAVSSRRHGALVGGITTPEYRTWSNIRQRAGNQNNSRYSDYGARGITICKRWEASFTDFLKDMGPKPSPKHSIDRIDNDKGYCPENCRWATVKEQQRNTRQNHRVTYRGETKTVVEWVEELGIPYDTLRMRLKRGTMTVEQAIETPVRKIKK